MVNGVWHGHGHFSTDGRLIAGATAASPLKYRASAVAM
jgi:hypothetical protein